MVNNFNLIYKVLKELPECHFIHMQIVSRRKDGGDNKVKKYYIITSLDELEYLEEEMKVLSKLYNARVYANLGIKSLKDLNRMLMRSQTSYILDEVYDNSSKRLNSLAGSLLPVKKTWVVDVDDPQHYQDIIRLLGDAVIESFPTVSGYNILTTKFNTMQFSLRYPEVDIHKNSMGVLVYYGKD